MPGMTSPPTCTRAHLNVQDNAGVAEGRYTHAYKERTQRIRVYENTDYKFYVYLLYIHV